MPQQHSADWKEPWSPANDKEREAVRDQLNRILGSRMFKNSKRCSLLLRFVVEKALNGGIDSVKERTIGFELFNREADYDTNEDPVVRATAVEVRKRLANYYYDARHEKQILIDLPARHYMPEFRMPTGDEPIRSSSPVPRNWLAIGLISAIVAAAIVVAALLLISKPFSNALDKFWNPVWNSSSPAVVCVGGFARIEPFNVDQSAPLDSPTNMARDQTDVGIQIKSGAYADTEAISRIVGLMMLKKKQFQIRPHTDLNLESFRNGTVVLIGGDNNQWTKRIVGDLRFCFDLEGNTRWIVDRLNPAAEKRSVPRVAQDKPVEGYAIISRISDSASGRIIVSIAGQSSSATNAAAEFLSEPFYMEKLDASAPLLWHRKNMQIVIATELDGKSYGPPRVDAVYCW
jgi:hypothetical protein